MHILSQPSVLESFSGHPAAKIQTTSHWLESLLLPVTSLPALSKALFVQSICIIRWKINNTILIRVPSLFSWRTSIWSQLCYIVSLCLLWIPNFYRKYITSVKLWTLCCTFYQHSQILKSWINSDTNQPRWRIWGTLFPGLISLSTRMFPICLPFISMSVHMYPGNANGTMTQMILQREK